MIGLRGGYNLWEETLRPGSGEEKCGYRTDHLEFEGICGVDRRLGLGCADGFRDSMIIIHVKVLRMWWFSAFAFVPSLG